jgi:hypothetical protein
MTVNLTGVANAQTLTITLRNVTDELSQVLPDTPVSIRIIAGDVNRNGTVNAADVAVTKSRIGEALTNANFESDVNVKGTINASDVGIVKANLGSGVP